MTEKGWTTTGDIKCIEEAFPAEVEKLIIGGIDNGENGDDYGRDVESSHDEDHHDIF